uniref:Uncharacterized protein n=1 Tax=Oryza meridionalis TaxID=40149 RepID=A0A0E0F3Z4_9ORYZ
MKLMRLLLFVASCPTAAVLLCCPACLSRRHQAGATAQVKVNVMFSGMTQCFGENKVSTIEILTESCGSSSSPMFRCCMEQEGQSD